MSVKRDRLRELPRLGDQPSLPADAVRVARSYRRDWGDLPGLAASIDELGLIHPIPVRPNGDLIKGERRLAAWKMSARGRRGERVPVHVIDVESLVRGRHDATVFHKLPTPEEMIDLARDVMPAIAEAARARQIELGRKRGRDPSANFAEAGETRTIVARMVGTSHATLTKIATVVDAARGDPDRFGRHLAAMNRSGRVDGPYKRIVVARQADAIRAEPPPMPSGGPYRVIAADPPWPFDRDSDDPSERGTHPYPQMSYAAIRALPVRALAHEDAALFLWTTNHHLPHAFSVVDAWGFSHRTVLTWIKDRIGRGQYLREQTEHCLVAIRGRPVFELGAESTVLQAARLDHSRKPDAFYGRVEAVCPAPLYAALFSHSLVRPRWDTHSTECLDGAPAPIVADEMDEVAA